MNTLVDAFFPLLESVMGDLLSMNPPPANKTLIEHLISKIFFAANNVLVIFSCSLARCLPLFPRTPSQDYLVDAVLRVGAQQAARRRIGDPH